MKIASFLLIGQSNMAGRGFLNDEPFIFNEHIKMLRNGRWQLMVEPIHYDRAISGIGLAASFAAARQLKYPDQEIGLIAAADGGTSLDDWAVGGVLFENAVHQAQLAQRSSTLTGILWHQGENDANASNAAVYKEKLGHLMAELRNRLQLPELPLIVGGLGDFLPKGTYGAYFAAYQLVNEALWQYVTENPFSYFVTAEGLTANEDQIHFNAHSLRLFGLRYFEALDKCLHVTTALPDEALQLQAIYNRKLSISEKTRLLENRLAAGLMSAKEFHEQLLRLSDEKK